MNSALRVSKRSWGARCRTAVQLLGAMFTVLLISLPAFSQGNTGRILGTVTDQSGGVVAGATVTVLDVDRGTSRTLTTDDAGAYNAPNLTPGNYTVRAEAKGFKRLERQSIAVQVGQEIRVDITIQPGEQNQTVTVTESVPLVETTNATLGGTLDNADIGSLPLNGRNYQNLVGLRPGVMIQPGGGPWTQSTNGVRPDETAWMVDGVINANFFDSRPVINMPSPFTDGATILPVDAIQEFNLMENPKAEYGIKPGAVVNVGIKSGTNQIHGNAYAFGRDGAWDARNFFNPAPSGGQCFNAPVSATNSCAQLPAQLKQFGAVVGGPIKKDKLFFFGGYEGLRSYIGNSSTANVPGTAAGGGVGNSMVDALNSVVAAGLTPSPVSMALLGCKLGSTPSATTCGGAGNQFAIAGPTAGQQLSPFANTNTSDNGIGKLDWHPNDRNQISGMFFLGNYTGVGEDHPFVAQQFIDSSPIRTWSTVVSWVYTPSSNVVNEMHFGYDRVDFGFLNTDLIPANGLSSGYPLNTGVTTPLGLPNIYINGYNYIGTNQNRPQSSSPNPYFDFSDSVSVLKGKHSFKFGGEFLHIEADSQVYSSGRGQIYFGGGNTPQIANPSNVCGGVSCPLEDFFAGNTGGGPGGKAGALLSGNPTIKSTWMQTDGFVQDDWRMTPKLIVNLGLRYEYTTPMAAANNAFGTFDPTSAAGMVQQGAPGYPTLYKPDHRNFEPRVGFAWDVTGKGTTVVRGGASVMDSSFVLFTWMAEFSLQNSPSTSIAAVPTGAILQTGACQLTNSCPTAGGNIQLGVASFPTLDWNGNSPANPLFPPPLAKCGDGQQVTPTIKNAAPCNIMGVDPNLRSPYIVNYNLGITHAFTPNLSLEVGYVGNKGYDLLGFRDVNQPNIAAGGTAQPYSPTCTVACASTPNRFPWLGYINVGSNQDHSNYNSLQATLTERMSHGLTFTAGYTYAHGIDTGSLNRFGLLPQDSFDPALEYASSDFDIRHRLTLSASYNIPGIKGFAQLLEGWQLNTIVNVQTAQPWTVSDSTFNFSGSGEAADRWNFSGNPSDFISGPTSIPWCSGYGVSGGLSTSSGVNCTINTISQGAIAAPAAAQAAAGNCSTQANAIGGSAITNLQAAGCFISPDGKGFMYPQATGQFGNMGRNNFRDSGFKDMDFSVFKNFTWKERYTAQFRVEVFNVFNHPVFANPYGASNAYLGGVDPSAPGNFGYSAATPDLAAGNPLIGSGSARDLQIGLKLGF